MLLIDRMFRARFDEQRVEAKGVKAGSCGR